MTPTIVYSFYDGEWWMIAPPLALGVGVYLWWLLRARRPLREFFLGTVTAILGTAVLVYLFPLGVMIFDCLRGNCL